MASHLSAFSSIISGDRKPKGEITPEARAAIIAAVQAGEKKSVIAARFRISSAAINRTLQRFEKTGQLVSRPRSGRPRTKPPRPAPEPAPDRKRPGPPKASAVRVLARQPACLEPTAAPTGAPVLLLAPPPPPPTPTSLARLLAGLAPTLHPATYVFTSLSPVSPLPPVSEIQLLFREPEGVTIVTSLDFATAHKMRFCSPCRIITCALGADVSSPAAAGLAAELAAGLAARNVRVNPVRAFYHDHVLVPLGSEAEAVEALTALADEKRRELVASQA